MRNVAHVLMNAGHLAGMSGRDARAVAANVAQGFRGLVEESLEARAALGLGYVYDEAHVDAMVGAVDGACADFDVFAACRRAS